MFKESTFSIHHWPHLLTSTETVPQWDTLWDTMWDTLWGQRSRTCWWKPIDYHILIITTYTSRPVEDKCRDLITEAMQNITIYSSDATFVIFHWVSSLCISLESFYFSQTSAARYQHHSYMHLVLRTLLFSRVYRCYLVSFLSSIKMTERSRAFDLSLKIIFKVCFILILEYLFIIFWTIKCLQ